MCVKEKYTQMKETHQLCMEIETEEQYGKVVIPAFLLLNKQRLNSKNCCQAASIIIGDLNSQKNFTPFPSDTLNYISPETSE